MGKVTIQLVEYDTTERIYGQGNRLRVNPVKKNVNITIKGLFLKSEEIAKEIKKQLDMKG